MWLKSVEASPTMHSVNSSETPWLLRFTCPRPVREHSHQRPWQGCVALEAYDPSEYDPFFLKTSTDCWKVSIPTLQDPLLKDIQRKFIETGIIKQCETGRPCSTRELNELSKAELPPLPLGRQPMDAAEWPKIPHAYIASEAHKTKRLFIERQHNSYSG
uniref:Uncharacterized protein n=1 Tax=Bubo bubo TaxID=30461 RepID=A0A8C0F2B8_BUBBB